MEKIFSKYVFLKIFLNDILVHGENDECNEHLITVINELKAVGVI